MENQDLSIIEKDEEESHHHDCGDFDLLDLSPPDSPDSSAISKSVISQEQDNVDETCGKTTFLDETTLDTSLSLSLAGAGNDIIRDETDGEISNLFSIDDSKVGVSSKHIEAIVHSTEANIISTSMAQLALPVDPPSPSTTRSKDLESGNAHEESNKSLSIQEIVEIELNVFVDKLSKSYPVPITSELRDRLQTQVYPLAFLWREWELLEKPITKDVTINAFIYNAIIIYCDSYCCLYLLQIKNGTMGEISDYLFEHMELWGKHRKYVNDNLPPTHKYFYSTLQCKYVTLKMVNTVRLKILKCFPDHIAIEQQQAAIEEGNKIESKTNNDFIEKLLQKCMFSYDSTMPNDVYVFWKTLDAIEEVLDLQAYLRQQWFTLTGKNTLDEFPLLCQLLLPTDETFEDKESS